MHLNSVHPGVPPKHKNRMNKIINMARMEYANNLTLDALADVACLSKFHFARIFSNYLGEPPHQYLMRLRVEEGANRLLWSKDAHITQVALDCGFSGSDDFARAFRRRFAHAPKNFRTVGQSCIEQLKLERGLEAKIYRPASPLNTRFFSPLSVKVQHRPEYHVAYIRHIGPYGNLGASISSAFSQLLNWARAHQHLPQKVALIGRPFDNCAITPAHQCMYDACLVLDETVQEDGVISTQTIPSGLYATVEVTCTAPEVNRVWDWLQTEWLPGSKYQKRASVAYEYMAQNITHKDEPFEVCICLPIQ